MDEEVLIDKKKKKKYIIIDIIGSGGFGKVYLSKNLETNELYAIKVLKRELKFFDRKMAFIKEISNFKSPYIISMIDYGEGEIKFKEHLPIERQYIVYEYASKGTLLEYLKYPYIFLEEQLAKILFKNILKGIQILHNNQICHGDIKPENILLDEKYNLKICDFGLAKKVWEGKIFTKREGTNGYCAPELYRKHKYDGKKADIFSLGATLLKIVTGKKDLDEYDYIKDLDNYLLKIDKTAAKTINLSEKLIKIIKDMTNINPKERPDINQLINNPWFDDIDENNINQMTEYYTEFNKRYEQIKANKLKNSINAQINNEENSINYNKSVFEKDEEDLKQEFILKNIDDNDININLKDFIKINGGDIKAIIIMNKITRQLKKDFSEYINNENKIKNQEGFFSLIPSKKYYKFKVEVTYEQDEEIEENNEEEIEEELEEKDNKLTTFQKIIKKTDLIIRAILLKSNYGYYILRFYKKSGDIEEYYEKLEKIFSIIKDAF